MKKRILAFAVLGLAGCHSTQTSVPANATSMRPVTPPANSGVTVPASTIPSSSSVGLNRPVTGGPGATVPAASGPLSNGTNLNAGPPSTSGFTRPATPAE